MVCFRGVTKMYAAGKHFVEVNKMVTAEVLRPAGAARSKGLGCCPTSSCKARGLCIDKDIACKALCVQKHCLQMLGPLQGHTDFGTKSSVLRLARRGVGYSELLSADEDAASAVFRC